MQPALRWSWAERQRPPHQRIAG